MGAFDRQIGTRVHDDNELLTEWLESRLHPVERPLAVCRAGEVASVTYRTYVLGLTSSRLICQPTDHQGMLFGPPHTVHAHDIEDTPLWHSGRIRRGLLSGAENQVRVTLAGGQRFRFVPLNGRSFEDHTAADARLAVVWSFVDWLLAADGAAARVRRAG